MNIEKYKTLIFDCDGVVLNSNSLKTEAFRLAALSYGSEAAERLVSYHVENGGVSRYAKFEYFLESILGLPIQAIDLQSLLEKFSNEVTRGLFQCELSPDLEVLKKMYPLQNWLIASGGDQAELRSVFDKRGLGSLFNGGIYGSPDTKYDILNQLKSKGHLSELALFLGDSRLDHEVAQHFDLDFLFVSQWTEFDGWEKYCEQHKILSITMISDLVL